MWWDIFGQASPSKSVQERGSHATYGQMVRVSFRGLSTEAGLIAKEALPRAGVG